MFRYDVITGKWLILALGSGLGLVLIAALIYLAIWRPRGGTAEQSLSRTSYIPMLLTLGIVCMLVAWVIYPLYISANPPNW